MPDLPLLPTELVGQPDAFARPTPTTHCTRRATRCFCPTYPYYPLHSSGNPMLLPDLPLLPTALVGQPDAFARPTPTTH
ncbi:MAG: hypothetical protein H6974_13755 [Gammaproteobacteria bacterium]|nr:hypothetical protein [Gammaproteobacteria bacterium]